MNIDVRFSNGSPQVARAFFTLANGTEKETEITVRYTIESGVATLDDIDVPLGNAGSVLNLNEYNALTSGIQNANTEMAQLSFIDSVA